MKIKELIQILSQYDQNQEVEICCYTSVANPDEMIIYSNIVDKNGNIPCQVSKKIEYVSLDIDSEMVIIG